MSAEADGPSATKILFVHGRGCGSPAPVGGKGDPVYGLLASVSAQAGGGDGSGAGYAAETPCQICLDNDRGGDADVDWKGAELCYACGQVYCSAQGLNGKVLVAPFYGRPGTENAVECVRLLQDAMGDDDSIWDIVGYSFGGLLAGLVAAHPATRARVRNLVLIAPAVDQRRRNGLDPNRGLVGYPGDQALTRPALDYRGRQTKVLVVHGKKDWDPAVVAEWVAELNAAAELGGEPPVELLTPEVGHAMYPFSEWLTAVAAFLA